MARRGRCRCGFVLKFKRGPDGYKTRCPSCGCMVRLQRVAARRTAGTRKAPRSRAVPASEAPAFSVPGFESESKASRTVTCEVCYALVPANASRCPDCGSVLDRTVAASPLDERQQFFVTTAPKSSTHTSMFLWLASSAVLLIAAIILILSLRH
jgi:hypothetical protein